MKKLIVKLLQPAINQWPILLTYIIWIGWSSLLQNPFYRWFTILLHAYLVAAFIEWSKSKVVKTFVYCILFVLFFIEATLETCYELAISPSILHLLVETNTRETQEFLSNLTMLPSFWLIICVATITVWLIWLSERNRLRIAIWLQQPQPYKIISIILPLWLIVGIGCSWCYISLFQCKNTDEVADWNLHMRYPSDAITRVVIALFDTQIAKHEMDEAINQAKISLSTKITPANDSLHIIFVIGESFIRQHSPLYGYPLNTTPFLLSEQEKGRLVAFTDAVSPYNLTTQVIRNLISCNSIGDNESWSQEPPLTAVFRAGGYNVEMYDNQKDFHLAATFSFALNTFLYHPHMVELCYDETNDRVFDYDGQLIDYYRHQKHIASTHKLTIFHLVGQHFQAKNRYPQTNSRFCRFTADSLSWRHESWLTHRKRQEIAHYDNATLYNDYVLQQIISLDSNNPTVVVYLSDHGEEVYDYRNSTGRFNSSDLTNMLAYQNCVPLMVWCNDQYLNQHPNIMEKLNNAKDRPLMTDNICQLLFRLAELTDQPYYKSVYDILSNDYQCGARILNNRYDYDKIVQAQKNI